MPLRFVKFSASPAWKPAVIATLADTIIGEPSSTKASRLATAMGPPTASATGGALSTSAGGKAAVGPTVASLVWVTLAVFWSRMYFWAMLPLSLVLAEFDTRIHDSISL